MDFKAKRKDTNRKKLEEKQGTRLWNDLTLKNFWNYVKLGVRPDVRINSVKNGQDPSSFNKEVIKESFYKEFHDRWQASIDPVEEQQTVHTDQGQFGEELDREVTMEELGTVLSDLKAGKAIGLDSIPNEVIKLLEPQTREFNLSFVNTCIRDRTMPSELKKGRDTYF